ncbi:hypothetical protein LTS15_001495 [Exophiala xenobiotica]|nr:hypothetical protein LTS15_001495 [Exophiala xenobiotica]
MAELLGLISSVVTVAQLATETVKHTKSFLQAHEEFEALQASLPSHSHSYAATADSGAHRNNLNISPKSVVITANLSKAKCTIEQLDLFIKAKVLRDVDGTSRPRRASWLRHKSEIRKIHDTLKEYRENILAAMSASVLSSITLISRDLVHRQATSSIASQQFPGMESTVYTQSAVRSLRLTSDSSVVGLLPRKRRYAEPPETETHRKKGCPPVNKFGCPDTSTSTQPSSTPPFMTSPPQPASSLELSSSFYPEKYTSDLRFPECGLLVARSYEESSSNTYRINVYTLFYLLSPRHWRRLCVSVRIHRTSKYWLVAKVSNHEHSTHSTNLLATVATPYSLLKEIRESLGDLEDVEEDSHLQLSLSTQDNVRKVFQYGRGNTSNRNTQCASSSQTVLTDLEDLGCNKYVDSNVAQIAPVNPPERFISSVDGNLVCELRFSSSTPSREVLYNIRVLRCMADIPGFAYLRGIVTDQAGMVLKSYLVDIPRSPFCFVWQKLSQDRTIAWEQREKWAMQLVEGLKALHSRGLVVGTLGELEPPIIIDSHDRVLLWKFKETFNVGSKMVCYYPPEFGYLRFESQSTSQEDSPPIKPKTDIFHLGLILWLFAEYSSQANRSPVCIRNRCDAADEPCYDECHLSPGNLPPLSEAIPQYYRDIVDMCRAEDPNDRPAAWRLLDMFPPSAALLLRLLQKVLPKLSNWIWEW